MILSESYKKKFASFLYLAFPKRWNQMVVVLPQIRAIWTTHLSLLVLGNFHSRTAEIYYNLI